MVAVKGSSKMLKVNKLSAWYKEDNIILKDITLHLKNNTVVGLLGLNGAGKTTLINTISGVHKSYSVKDLKFYGKEIKFDDIEWKEQRYTVFTEEQAFTYWSFREYLPFVAKVYKKQIDYLRVEELIKGFGFDKYKDYPIKDLSTGNRKKIFLITGFALGLPLLILDEPLDGLDYLASEFLYKEIIGYKKYGTVLMSSHIAESIEKTCDEVLVLKEGKIRTENLSEIQDIRTAVEGWL